MNYSNWMKSLGSKISSKTIFEIAIPGSHDSCTYSITDQSGFSPDAPAFVDYIKNIPGISAIVKKVVADWAITQGRTVTEQLNDGIRYFDLRTCLNTDDDNMYIVHAMYGMNVFDVIDEISAFTKANTEEIVLLDFNHFYEMTNSSHDQLYNKLVSAFGDTMIPQSSCLTDTIGDFWKNQQNVIVFYDEADMAAKHSDLCSENQIDSPWPNVTTADALKSALEANLKAKPNGIVYVTQGIITEDGEIIAEGLIPFSGNPSSMEELASTITPEVVSWLPGWQSDYGLNVVICDWYQKADYISTVVGFNQ